MRTLFHCPLFLVVTCSCYLPEEYQVASFPGDDSRNGLRIQRSAWFDSGYMRCVSLRGFWKNFGVIQTVQKTVKVPHAFFGMVVDKCRMVETVQKLWSLRSWCCSSLSLFTAVLAAAAVSQMSWTTSNSCDGDLAASSFSVSCVLGSVAQDFDP